MNILITFLSAKKDTFGGMERSIYSLIKGLEYNGCNVYVYTAMNSDNNKNFIYSRYLKYTFNDNPNMIDYNILESYKSCSLMLKEEILSIIDNKRIQYILVIDQLWGIIPHIDVINDIKCNIGIVYHMCLQEELIKKSFELPFSDYFAVSKDVCDKINKLNVLNKKIDILPNSYNEEYFFEKKVKKQRRIFCNTRLAENKGIEYLLEAFKRLHKDYADYELILCGGKYHFGDCNIMLRYINKFLDENVGLIEKIHILNNLNWSEVPEWIQNSQMVVLPSGYESFGIAALETIACRTALISTTEGNLPNLIEDAGVLVPYGDVDALYNAIKSIIEDKELVLKLYDNCNNIRKKYEAKRVAKDLLSKINRG